MKIIRVKFQLIPFCLFFTVIFFQLVFVSCSEVPGKSGSERYPARITEEYKDSLFSVWNDNKSDPESRLDAIYDLMTIEQIPTYQDSMLKLSQQMLELARKLNRSDREAFALVKIGRAFHYNSALDSAEKYYNMADSILEFKDDDLIRIQLLIYRADILIKPNFNYSEALTLLMEADAYCKNKNTLPYIVSSAFVKMYIGEAQMEMGNLNAAVLSYKESYVISSKVGLNRLQPEIVTRIAIANIITGDYKNALEYLNLSRKIALKYGLLDMLFWIEGESGSCYYGLKQYDQSITSFQNSIRLAKGNDRALNIMRLNIAECYIELGLVDSARFYINEFNVGKMQDKSLDLFSQFLLLKVNLYENNIQETIDLSNDILKNIGGLQVEQRTSFYWDLFQFYKKLGNYEQALKMFELAFDNKMAIENEESKQSLLSLRYEIEYEKKAEIDSIALAQTQFIAKASLEKQEQRNYLLSSLLFLSVIFIGIVANRWRVTRNQKRIIEDQKEEVLSAYALLKSTQSQLIQAEKMASLGQVTAGIAHEIQNPLNFVNNFSDLSIELMVELQEELANATPEQAREIINDYLADLKSNSEKVKHHGKRAESIVKSMLMHSSSGSMERAEVQLNELLEEYTQLSYHGIRAENPHFNCGIKLDLDPQTEKIIGIQQQLGRSFLNILGNAMQAMEEKQKQLGDAYQPELLVSTHKTGDSVEIRIRDNGPGIPVEIRDKIFQPFFTTKDTGRGTGLGLSLVYDMIVKGHDGKLEVKSEEGEFTEFFIYLNIGI